MGEVVDLHDAALLTITFDWKMGTGTLRVRPTSHSETAIVATGVRFIAVHPEHPWGPSVYINEVRGPARTEADLQRVEIQMQSGDLITIAAESIELP